MSKLKGLAFVATFFVTFNAFAEDPSWNASLMNDATRWTDEGGKAIDFKSFKDKPLVLGAFYTHCSRTCPEVTFRKLKEIQKQFDDRKIEAEVVMVSLEPDQDTVEALYRFKQKMAKDHDHWHFVRSNTDAETKNFVKTVGLGDYWRMEDHTLHDFKLLYFSPKDQQVKTLDYKNRDVASLF